MGVGGQRHTPADLPPVKTRYPLYRTLSRPQGRSGQVWKISPPPGFDPRTVQAVASRYTDWAIPALLGNSTLLIIQDERRSHYIASESRNNAKQAEKQQTDQMKTNKENQPSHVHKKVSWNTYEIIVSEIKSLWNSHELIYTGNHSTAPG